MPSKQVKAERAKWTSLTDGPVDAVMVQNQGLGPGFLVVTAGDKPEEEWREEAIAPIRISPGDVFPARPFEEIFGGITSGRVWWWQDSGGPVSVCHA